MRLTNFTKKVGRMVAKFYSEDIMANVIWAWRIPAEEESKVERLVLGNIATVDEGARMLPGGGYTTFRTFGKTKIMRIANHYNRLEETSILAKKEVRLKRNHISVALREALLAFPTDEARVRMILDLERKPGDIYLLLEPLHTPSTEQYQNGVAALTRAMQRTNPKAKLTGFIETAAAARETMPPGINEILMVGEDGRVLEGLSSNYFAVRSGVVITADEGVLSGITRKFVLEEIQRMAIPLDLTSLAADQLPDIHEAFITSASRAVLPVTQIDGSPVGDGMVGPITRALQAAYHARVEQELEEI